MELTSMMDLSLQRQTTSDNEVIFVSASDRRPRSSLIYAKVVEIPHKESRQPGHTFVSTSERAFRCLLRRLFKASMSPSKTKSLCSKAVTISLSLSLKAP